MGKPQGVKIHREDGTVLSCELVHYGENEEGLDLWAVAGVEFHPESDRLTIELMPERTALALDYFGTPSMLPEGIFVEEDPQ